MNQSLPCPDCGERLPAPVPSACPNCSIRLSGPLAIRLWKLDVELGDLEERRTAIGTERRALIEALHAPPGPAEAVQRVASYDDPRPAPVGPAPVMPAAAGRTLSVQQLLLGLGAVLLLSALGFLGLVMWLVVGIWGQAAILLALTAGCAVGSGAFNRRGLAAAAETFGLMAAGLMFMDAVAIRSFGLFGLDAAAFGLFWAVAAAVGAGLLLAVDRAAGETPRRLVSLRPLATTAAVAVPWLLAGEIDHGGIEVPVVLGAIALVDGAVAAAVLRLSHRVSNRTESPSFVVAMIATGLALLGYEVSALLIAYDLEGDLGDRYLAWALALIPLVALAVVVVRRPASTLLQAGLGFGVLLAAGVPLLDAPWWSLPIVAAVAAAILLVAEMAGPGGRLLGAVAAVIGVLTYPILLILTEANAASLRDLLLDTGDHTTVPAIAAMAPALIATGVFGVAAWRARADTARLTTYVAGVIVSVLAVELAFLLDRDEAWWFAIGLADVVVLTALAAVAVIRAGADALPVEVLLLGAAAGSAMVTFGFAAALDDQEAGLHVVLLLAIIGVGGLAYALLPGRFAASYLGSAFISSAWWVFLAWRSGSLPIEIYTLPAAALIGLVGLAQARRFRNAGRTPPSLAVYGPALTIALLPSVQVGLDDSDALRLGLTSLVAVALVLLGVGTRTKAPVVVGGIAILEIALLQGGPVLSGFPFWLTGGIAGAILLWAGVRWEATVATGKRSAAWFESLH